MLGELRESAKFELLVGKQSTLADHSASPRQKSNIASSGVV